MSYLTGYRSELTFTVTRNHFQRQITSHRFEMFNQLNGNFCSSRMFRHDAFAVTDPCAERGNPRKKRYKDCLEPRLNK